MNELLIRHPAQHNPYVVARTRVAAWYT